MRNVFIKATVCINKRVQYTSQNLLLGNPTKKYLVLKPQISRFLKETFKTKVNFKTMRGAFDHIIFIHVCWNILSFSWKPKEEMLSSKKKREGEKETEIFPVCLAHQCPVNYWPAKQKRGERFGGEHHLSLDISPKPVVNEVDNCLVILLARAHSIGGIQGRFCTAIKLYFFPLFLLSPPPATRINRKSPRKYHPFILKPSKLVPKNAHRSVNVKQWNSRLA